MDNKNENTKQERFEFVLKINRNIICQRYFEAKGYNEDALTSLELKEAVDHVVDDMIIDKKLKKNTRRYLWNFHNPLETQSEEQIPGGDIWEDGLDTFEFIVRMDGRPIMSRLFYGNYYPPRIRYKVDIKDIVPDIVDTIRDVLSSNEVTNLK